MLPTKQPHKDTINNLASTIHDAISNRIHNGHRIVYDEEDIICLLNNVSQRDNIPQSLQFRWGDAVRAAQSQHHCMDSMGIRGGKTKQQNKQAIVSSSITFDNNGNINNKKYCKSLLPHKSNPGKNAFLNKAATIRNDFESGRAGILCEERKLSRNS